MTTKGRVYVVLGFLMVALATAGIVLPLLPTTPFLLLAAFFFSGSSPRWASWLSSHRHFGPYLRAFREKQGLTTRQKVRMILSFSVLLGISFYFAPLTLVRAGLAAFWIFLTLMVVRVRRAEEL